MVTVQKLHAVRASAITEYFTDVEVQKNTGYSLTEASNRDPRG
jgi:hypothetical protein